MQIFKVAPLRSYSPVLWSHYSLFKCGLYDIKNVDVVSKFEPCMPNLYQYLLLNYN